MHPVRTLSQCAGEGRMRGSLLFSKSLSQHVRPVCVLPTMDGSSSCPKIAKARRGAAAGRTLACLDCDIRLPPRLGPSLSRQVLHLRDLHGRPRRTAGGTGCHGSF